MRVAALVLAAGRGERLGHDLPKGFVCLAGRPLWLHSAEALASVAEIERVVPVIPEGERERFRACIAASRPPARLAEPVIGGATRQDSVRAGLEALPASAEWVAVHDAARPLLQPEAVARLLAAARLHGAAILARPVGDTIKRVAGERIVETPDRAECWAAQTPQVFRTELLREALAKAAAEGFEATDDAQLVERLGVTVHVVEGDPDNLKITRDEDLATAEAWLERRSRRSKGGAGTS